MERQNSTELRLNEPILAMEPAADHVEPLHDTQNTNSNEQVPPDEPVETDETQWYQCPLQLVAMLSNYSTSYNVVNISMVIPILEHVEKGTSPEDVAASASSLLAGMVVGQLVGGYLGDSPVLGRLGALQLVMALQVVASLGSAMLWSGAESFYVWLAVCRFLLGVGAGGVYPLAAVLSAEQGTDKQQVQSEEEQAHRVVLTFSMQGLGFITVPLVTVPLLYMTSNLNIVWRTILALGAVPGLILMAFQLYIHRTDSHQAVPLEDEHAAVVERQVSNDLPPAPETADQENLEPSQSEEEDEETLLRNMQIMEEELRESRGRWESIREESNVVQKLLGTAGTWFLFDVLFYGNSLFESVVLDAAFGGSSKGGDPIDELRDTAIKSLFVYGIALPGYFVASGVMGKRLCYILQTPKYVMLQGFAAMGTLYLTLGLNWSFLKHTPVLLVFLYGMTFFFANYGPNTTTFILPSMVFSSECRTTLNGVSAAAGKLGALTGATLFEPLVEDIGDANVMLICAGVAILAWIMTWKFVQMHPTNNDHPVNEVV